MDDLSSIRNASLLARAAEVTPVAEIGPYNFVPGAISRKLVEAYAAEVQPKVLA